MKNVESSLFLFLIVVMKWFVMKSCSYIFSRLLSWQRAPFFTQSISALNDRFIRIRSFITSELIVWWQDLIICGDCSALRDRAGWTGVCQSGLKSQSLSVFGGRCDRSVSSYLVYQRRVSLCERIEKTHNGNSTVTIDWCSCTEPINESYSVYSQGRCSLSAAALSAD